MRYFISLISGSPRDRSRGGDVPNSKPTRIARIPQDSGVGEVVGGRNYRGLTFRLHSPEDTCIP